MSLREREGLIARIRHLRRVEAAADFGPSNTAADSEPAPLRALEDRVAHLERLLEGFQDSVYREAERQNKRITDLEMRTQPAALVAALSKDARERGL